MSATITAPTSPTGASVRTRPEHTVSRTATVAAVTLGAFFAGAGVMRLLPVEFDVALFASWGLPGWLRTGVGVAELAAGALTLLPRTRAIGAAGLFTIMVSAGTVHAVLGHDLRVAVALNGTLALWGLAVAWAHRRQLAEL